MLVFAEKKSLKHHTKNAMIPRFGENPVRSLQRQTGFQKNAGEDLTESRASQSDHKTHKTILVSLNVSGNHKEET